VAVGLYDYTVPPRYGDTFFQYVYAADALTNGSGYFQQVAAAIDDGDFILRSIAGFETVINPTLGSLQFYDPNLRNFFASPAFLGGWASSKAVMPEKYYPARSAIKMDIADVAKAVAGVDGGLTVYRSQLIFSGVRRRANYRSDPGPSTYKYYEKEYSIPFTEQGATTPGLVINNYASTGGVLNPYVQRILPIQDFDFELRRIELQLQTPQQPSQFLMTLYDNNWIATSSAPVLSNHLCHLDPTQSSGETSFFPCPPVLYKVNSVIRFDIWSLLFSPTVLPQTFNLTFVGVRRIPCSS
jgi:hypothetical protein